MRLLELKSFRRLTIIWDRTVGQSDEIVVPELGRPIVEYEDKGEEQKEEKEDGYYEALGHSFGDVYVSFKLTCPTLNHVDEMVERFVRDVQLQKRSTSIWESLPGTVSEWVQCTRSTRDAYNNSGAGRMSQVGIRTVRTPLTFK